MRPSAIWKSLAITLWIAALLSAYLIRQPEAQSATLFVRMSVSAGGAFQVYFDTGDGYSEPASVRLPIVRTDGTAVDYTVPLPAGRIRTLRIDPVDAPGSVRLEQVEVLDHGGRRMRVAEAGALRPANQIASLEYSPAGVWCLATSGTGDDPSVEWQLTPLLDLTVSPWRWGLPLGLGLCGLALVVVGWRWVCGTQWASGFMRWLDRHSWLPNGILAVVAWSVLFDVPLPPIAELDSSWQQVMGLAAVKHWAFGREIVFTGGPLSFLNLPYAIPETVMLRLIWDGVGKLALCGLTLWVLDELPLWRRMVVVWLIIGFGRMFTDGVYLFMVLAYVVGGLIRSAHWRKTACALAGVVFFGLVKFTFLLTGVAGVTVAAGVALARGEHRRAAGVALAFPVCYGAAWMALGQPLTDLPAYLSSSLALSEGYVWAMSLEEPHRVFFCGVGIWLLMVVGVSWSLRQLAWRSHLTEWAVVLFSGVALALSWKHGFTRAAGHVLGFFWFSALWACTLPGWLTAVRRPFRFECVVPVALLGAWLAFPAMMWSTPDNTWGRMRSCWQTLRAPREFLHNWQDRRDLESRAAALPKVCAAVGRATIDSFNFDQGHLLLNGLNYSPRPTIQGYTSYTPRLQQSTLDWLRSGHRPAFFLWRTSSIDGRFAPQDEALLWPELPRYFELGLEEGGFALLRRRAVPLEASGERRCVWRGTAVLGETVPVPAAGPLWIQISAHPSRLGRLRAFLYKPAQLELVVVDTQGHELRRRLLPKVAESGFLISPVIDTQSDFLSYMRGEEGAMAGSIRIEAPAGHGRFWGEFEIQVLTLPAQTPGVCSREGEPARGDLSKIPWPQKSR